MCKKEACKVASFLHMSCLFNMGLESLENNQQICRSLNLICYDSSMFNSWLIHTYINKHLSSELDFLASDINAMLTLGQYLQSFVNVLVLMSMYVIHCLMRIL